MAVTGLSRSHRENTGPSVQLKGCHTAVTGLSKCSPNAVIGQSKGCHIITWQPQDYDEAFTEQAQVCSKAVMRQAEINHNAVIGLFKGSHRAVIL